MVDTLDKAASADDVVSDLILEYITRREAGQAPELTDFLSRIEPESIRADVFAGLFSWYTVGERLAQELDELESQPGYDEWLAAQHAEPEYQQRRATVMEQLKQSPTPEAVK